MLSETCSRLVDTLADPNSTEDQARAAAHMFVDAMTAASPADRDEGLARFAAALGLEAPRRAAFAALVAGALVEHGLDPAPVVPALVGHLERLLAAAGDLADACRAKLPAVSEADEERDEDGAGEDDPDGSFEAVRLETAAALPLESEAWDALETSWRAGVSIFSVSREARAAARRLRPVAERSAEHHEGSHWLAMILSVLDDEPFVALEASTGRGIAGAMSGVVDNFQLQMLLMDAVSTGGLFSKRRIAKAAADVAKGLGPQQLDDTIVGAWNMYAWTAVSPDRSLPDPRDFGAKDHWIWGEGRPEDIPVFDGRRVVLLGPASYPREFGAQRMFDRLRAELRVERVLSKKDVADWLARLAAAPRP